MTDPTQSDPRFSVTSGFETLTSLAPGRWLMTYEDGSTAELDDAEAAMVREEVFGE